MKKPKRVRRKARFEVGEVVAQRKLNCGITEYGVVEHYDPKYRAAYGIQLSSMVGTIWLYARELRPLNATEIGPRRKRG